MKILVTLRQLAFVQLCAISFFASAVDQKPIVPTKDWNFMVYMSNNNNLHRFGVQNFGQMVKVGSGANANILLQMDHLGERAISRFYIEKNRAVLLESHANTTTSFSGSQANLTEFAEWGLKNFESKNACLVLWNHGAGIKDTDVWGRYLIRNRDSLFTFNYTTGLLELDHSIKKNKKLLTQINTENKKRGIAFNDAAEAFLTNQHLKDGLEQICTKSLSGKKIEIISMDACHMAMIEVASQIKNSANFMVASEEVEPGAGLNYITALSSFINKNMDSATFARHIVQSYRAEYEKIMGDYTQSAVDLSFTDQVEKNLDTLAQQLIVAINDKTQEFAKSLLKLRMNRMTTTEFYDADYVDLGHLYKSLSAIAPDSIKTTCAEGLALLKKMVIENAAGRNLPEASGLAIYFPTRTIHKSYYKTEFVKNTAWAKFLETFIKTTRAEMRTKTPAKKELRSAHIRAYGKDHKRPQQSLGVKDACCTDCATKSKSTGKKTSCCSTTTKTTITSHAHGHDHGHDDKHATKSGEPCCGDCATKSKVAGKKVSCCSK